MKSCVPVSALALLVVLSPSLVESQVVHRDESSFLAAIGEVTVQGFESYSSDECSTGGVAPLTTFTSDSFSVSTDPLDGGTSFLCIGSTNVGGPNPTDGHNALIAGSVTFDRYALTFTLTNRPVYAIGFYITDAAEQGDVLFTTDRGQQALIAPCCGSGETVFFGFISDKPIKSFRVTSTGTGDGLGIDELTLAFRRKQNQ